MFRFWAGPGELRHTNQEILKNLSGHGRIGYETDHLHHPSAVGAAEGIRLVNLLDTFPPGLGRNLFGLIIRSVYERHSGEAERFKKESSTKY